MKTIVNKGTDPYYNLALEEYLLRRWKREEELFYLWRNSPVVVVGRNQNVFSELNLRETEKDGVPIVRRVSGGGSVYHDLGNLNFTFLAPYSKENLNNYRKFTEPILSVLNGLGVPAEFSGKSDLVVDGKKISGNAQSFLGGRMIHHGTLLFDADLERLNSYLKMKESISSFAVRSRPSQVANLKAYFPEGFGIQDLASKLLEEIVLNSGGEVIHLREEELAEVEELKNEKYLSWDWNYGESPEFAIKAPEASVRVKEGRIRDFCSDLLPEGGKSLEPGLLGNRFLEKEVEATLSGIEEGIKRRIIDALFK